MGNARTKAANKWAQKNTRQVMLKLHTRNDADILERLDACENKQGYIKRLIREDIERGE